MVVLRSLPLLIDRGIRINAEYYCENILKGVLQPWPRKHFGRRPWKFQKDSAPSHSARAIQEWLQNKVPRFISSAQWPPKSSDTNPLNYWVFWKARLTLKILKCRLPQASASPGLDLNTAEQHSGSVRRFHWPFEGHNSCQRWPIRTNLNLF